MLFTLHYELLPLLELDLVLKFIHHFLVHACLLTIR